ncbi:MAG: MFS transporter [Bacillota bacterium]
MKQILTIKEYNRTICGCYLSLFMQAFCCTCPAILYVSLQTLYGLSYTQLGALAFITFAVQIIIDIAASHPVDKYGFRPFILSAPIFVIVGVAVFISAPLILENPYPLFVVGTMIFSIASGLLEVMVSPLIDNLPTTNKARSMALLHAFYGVGQIFTVLVATLMIHFLGSENWQIVMGVFIVIPIISLIILAPAPIVNSKDINRTIKFSEFLTKPTFLLLMCAICLGAMCEIIMAQWASSFFETTLGFEKLYGDLLALCSFSIFFTVGRLIYAKFGKHLSLSNACILGSIITAVCYAVLVFQSNVWVSIVACAVSGFGVCMLWPGTITLATTAFPNASTKLFGTLSGAGDLGGAIGPFLLGIIADAAGLQIGLSVAIVAAVLNIFVHLIIKKRTTTVS